MKTCLLTTLGLFGALTVGAAPTILNPSFEANSFTVGPGYISGNSPITGWTTTDPARAGLNPASGSPFADNGIIPHGNNVAFIQSAPNSSLSTVISDLIIGQSYKVDFRVNARSSFGGTPNLKISIDGLNIINSAVTPVGGSNPYKYFAFDFTAAATSQTMTLSNDASGDHTVLLDDFGIAVRDSGWSYAAWNDDASSGVTSDGIYTHAYNFGSTDSPEINGIVFTGIPGGNPSENNRFRTAGLPNVFPNDANNVTGAGSSQLLARDFLWGGLAQSITIDGLVFGKSYVATIYSVGWENGTRAATFSVGSDQLTVNQDQFGDNNGIRVSYNFTATSNLITLAFVPLEANTFHVYGFSVCEVLQPSIVNPSFEIDPVPPYPGYGSITGWTLSGGGLNDANGPFHDNGAIPDGAKVAFIQHNGALSQVITGFIAGVSYQLRYFENARNCCGGAVPFAEVRIGGVTIVAPHAVPPVGGANPYYEILSDPFVATATSLELAFIKSSPQGGDTSLLIDNVSFVPRRTARALVVTKLADGGPGSLRQAIADARPGDTITFGTSGTITLNGSVLFITKDLTIVGSGPANLAVSGNNARRVLSIGSGSTVGISGLTIRNGLFSSGGGVQNSGTLVMSNCVITANATFDGSISGTGGNGGLGGGIYNNGSLTLIACTINNNRAGNGQDGGNGADGVPLNPHGGRGGSGLAGGDGGGIYNVGAITLIACTVNHNTAGDGGTGGSGGNGVFGTAFPPFGDGGGGGGGGRGGFGGGLYNGASATLTLSNCTLYGNSAGRGGRGGYGGAPASNIFGSGTPGGGAGGGQAGKGGGVHNADLAELALTACTVSSNNAGAGGSGGLGGLAGGPGASGGDGGGLYTRSVAATTLRNTLVAGNQPGSRGTGGLIEIWDGSGADLHGTNFVSHGYNLIGSSEIAFVLLNQNTTDIVPVPYSQTNALLAALGDHGGLTLTVALLNGSPAIDAGDDTLASSFTTDQRGASRLSLAHVDIGAFEAQAPIVLNTNDSGPGSLRHTLLYSSPLDTLAFHPSLSGQTIHLTSGQLTIAKSLTIDASSLAESITVDAGQNSRILQVGNTGVQVTNIFSPSDPIEIVYGANDGDPAADPPPAAETVNHAIDRITQKYLNFLDLGSGFAATPVIGPAIAQGIRFYTANDSEPRDPASYRLEGSTTAGLAGPWTNIASGNLTLPSGRNPGGTIPINPAGHFNQTVTFANTAIHTSYRVIFPTLKDAASANSMQIAEVELLGVPFTGPPIVLTLNSLTFTRGSADYGGAILVSAGATLTLDRTTISSNSAFNGGAIANYGTLTVRDSTVVGNSATNDGGGIVNNSGALKLNNSTLAGNSAAFGGGIHNVNSATTTIDNSTISGNSANTGGGLNNPAGTCVLTNTIIAGNTANNISGSFSGANNLTKDDPLLAPLDNYGGPTPTMPPLPGSPAIDAGTDAVTAFLAGDQRGYARQYGAHVDIGAVEARFSVVTDLSDSGAGSLRAAVASGPELITFAGNLSGQTITLTSGQIAIASDLAIDASALTDGISVSGDHNSRIFQVNASATVILDSLALMNGRAVSGGGILVRAGGSLTLTGTTLSGNSADNGGGIQNNGALTLINSLIFNNFATNNSGGIENNGGTIIVADSRICRNLANYGGGMANYRSGTITISHSEISDNRSAQSGGGIFLYDGALTIGNSTFAENSARFGAGIGIFLGALTIHNSTFADNSATNSGGAIRNNQGGALVLNSTLSGNSAGGTGGGIDNYSTLVLTNTIVAGNTATANPNIYTAISGSFSGATSLTNGNPLLAPLDNYGGPTRTMPPLHGSPALDAGTDSVTNFLATDQRGYPRQSGARVDIGAVEAQWAPANNPPLLVNPAVEASGEFSFSFTNAPYADFTVLASTNLSQWIILGPAMHNPPGQYHFIDPNAANHPKRFYKVASP